MIQFLAQNHSAMTHLPIASSILAAAAAVAVLFVRKKEITWSMAVLFIAAFVTVIPTVVTGIAAAKGRLNEQGQPYLQTGMLVPDLPANVRIHRHQLLGISGSFVAAILAFLGISILRGRNPNGYLIALLALVLAVLWGLGGHLGGQDLWGADTFPAFR